MSPLAPIYEFELRRVKRVVKGCPGRARDTFAAFASALDAGVDMIEFDVLRYRGRLVLAHSHWDALRRDTVTLEDALTYLAAPRFAAVEFNVDLKLPGYETETVGALHRAGVADRCLISSQYKRTIRRVRALDPQLRVAISVGGRWARRYHRWPRGPLAPAIANLIRGGRLNALMAHHSLVCEELLALVAAAGGEVYAWTVDDPARARALSDLGVAGVTSNDPLGAFTT